MNEEERRLYELGYGYLAPNISTNYRITTTVYSTSYETQLGYWPFRRYSNDYLWNS